jgi:MSHA biogenesis protein MshN
MSLINSMLRDLDKRRAGEEARKGLPTIVRPLPAARTGAPTVTKVIVGLLVIVAAASGWWYLQPAFVAPVLVAAVAVVPPAPTPPPVEIKPADPGERVALPPAPQQQATPAEGIAQAPLPETKAPKAETPLASSPPAVVLGTLRLDSRLKTAPPPNPATEADGAAKPVSKPVAAPVTMRPEREEDDWQRAQVLLRESRIEQAEPLLRRALQSQPSNAAIRQALIGMLLTARRHAEAADQMRQGLALAPEQTTWAMNLARLHVEKNDYPSAWEVLTKSATYAQQSPEYLAFCGTVLQRMNRSSEALPYYRNALQIKPREGRWWVGYGIALEADGKAADARESYQRARSLGDLPTEVMNFVEHKLR